MLADKTLSHDPYDARNSRRVAKRGREITRHFDTCVRNHARNDNT